MKLKNPSKLCRVVTFILTAALVVGLDLWSKSAIFKLLEVQTSGPPPRVVTQREYTVIPGFFDLQANYNYGAFSGWFSEHPGWLASLSAAALAVLAGIFVYQLRKNHCPGVTFTLSLAFLWGGTLGNLYDRLFLKGVRDWIKWYFIQGGREHVWPNFNVADSAICTGVGLLVLLEVSNWIRGRKQARRETIVQDFTS